MTIQSGFPVSISRNANSNGQSAALDNPTLSKWFDTSTFTVAPSFTYGNVGPVLPGVRTDAVRNIDVVLVKNFSEAFAIMRSSPSSVRNFTICSTIRNLPGQTESITSQSFGQITSQANSPRDIQFGLKVNF